MKKIKRAIVSLVLCPVLLGASPVLKAADDRIESLDKISKNIVIDGKSDEWGKYTKAYHGGKIKAASVMDDQYLYAHLYTEDRIYHMQIMNFGLILDIGQQVPSNQRIRIEYPVVKIQPPPPPKKRQSDPRGEEKSEMIKRFAERTGEIALEINGGKKKVVPFASNKDIMVRIDANPQSLSYEIRLPRKRFGLAADEISVQFMSPKVDFEKLRKKFGAPKEDQHNGKQPPKDSSIQRPEIVIDPITIKMDCKRRV